MNLKGEVNIFFEVTIEFINLKLDLHLKIKELKGIVKMMTRIRKNGKSKFQFCEVPFHKSEARLSLPKFKFLRVKISLDYEYTVFKDFINGFILKEIVYPEFINNPIPMTKKNKNSAQIN